jgi:site-specific recombinase XerD
MASRYSIHPQIWQRLYEGPLGPYVDALVALLEEQGYCQHHIAIHVRATAALSGWLERQGGGAPALTPEGLARYTRSRQRRGRLRQGETVALRKLLDFLRPRGVVTAKAPPRSRTVLQQTAEAFERYLVQERGLALATVRNYLPIVCQFLPERFGQGPIRFAALTPADITGFVQRHAREGSAGRARLLVTRLRAFLRYLRQRGALATDLAGCVPSVAAWSFAGVPKALAPDEVQQVLKSCDRRTPAGRRDYAILLLLARLGLRAGEVVDLTLDDLDWEAGRLTLRSKGGRRDQLPLPADVGAAVAAYLQRGRPPCTSRRLFLRLRAPWGGLADHSTVSTLVARRLAHAGIQAPHTGAHVFRHTLATDLLRHGASLAEIGALLRHRSPNTTARYAKVDFAALRPLALPWPGGGR